LDPALSHIFQPVGYIYPNEVELQWSMLIVLYPYITGLVAGAFILASLDRVFNVVRLSPVYRLSLLSALAFLLTATLPLNAHLGHPERAYEIMMTPHLTSAMAVFGFVYAWYLMAVLLVELWLDYRKELVLSARNGKGPKRWIHALLTLGVFDISDKALRVDDRLGKAVTIIGIPSAFLLHGYVGFIFGSIKANPWWSTVLMPIVFIFSAMVSGIAMVLVLYVVLRRGKALTTCLDTLGKYLFYALLIDFALEGLEIIHRIYVMEESFEIIRLLVSGPLFITMFLFQFGLGTILPLVALGAIQLFPVRERLRRVIYPVTGLLVLFGVFFMRWNVVTGGQLFSKSLRGFAPYKLDFFGQEGLLVAIAIFMLPFLILAGLLWLFDPWKPSMHSESNA
jgi:predicted membrane protein